MVQQIHYFCRGNRIRAVLALLFAPSSGEETRDYISDSVKKGIDDAASAGKRWSRRAHETVDDVKATVAGAVEAGRAIARPRDAKSSSGDSVWTAGDLPVVSRLEGLCRPLDRAVLVSGAAAAETSAALIPLGAHALRGIAQPCAVFTVPDG